MLAAVGRLLEPELRFTGAARFEAGGAAHRIGAFEHVATGMVLHLVPGGTTRLGPATGPAPDRVEAAREARLGAFLIGRFPVLQAEWDRLGGGPDRRSFDGPDLPIEGITWREAQAWLARARLRLPSEAEWEHACRAGTTARYYWGEAMDAAWCWFGEGQAWRTHAPREHLPRANAFGLVDTLGNVAEWCQDAFLPYRADAPGDGRAIEPARRGGLRVLRGGDGFQSARQCTAAARNGALEGDWGGGIGLRAARSLP